MRRLGFVMVVLSLSVPLAACGGDDTPPPDGGPARDGGAMTARDGGAMTARDGGGMTVHDGGGTAQDGDIEPGYEWYANATEHRGMNDMVFSYPCPAPGTPWSVWGTDIYSDDSSVCTAGVHAGAITLAGGGTVQIRIRPGQAMYTGSERNGITSRDWTTPWEGSFEVVMP